MQPKPIPSSTSELVYHNKGFVSATRTVNLSYPRTNSVKLSRCSGQREWTASWVCLLRWPTIRGVATSRRRPESQSTERHLGGCGVEGWDARDKHYFPPHLSSAAALCNSPRSFTYKTSYTLRHIPRCFSLWLVRYTCVKIQSLEGTQITHLSHYHSSNDPNSAQWTDMLSPFINLLGNPRSNPWMKINVGKYIVLTHFCL